MWKNTVEHGRPRIRIWRMRVKCCKTKATDTHSESVIRVLHFHSNKCRANALDCHVIRTLPLLCVISVLLRELHENCVLLVCHAASNGIPFSTFRDSLSVHSTRVKDETDIFLEKRDRCFVAELRWNQEERSSLCLSCLMLNWKGFGMCHGKILPIYPKNFLEGLRTIRNNSLQNFITGSRFQNEALCMRFKLDCKV
jgi:hypothetical protein